MGDEARPLIHLSCRAVEWLNAGQQMPAGGYLTELGTRACDGVVPLPEILDEIIEELDLRRLPPWSDKVTDSLSKVMRERNLYPQWCQVAHVRAMVQGETVILLKNGEMQEVRLPTCPRCAVILDTALTYTKKLPRYVRPHNTPIQSVAESPGPGLPDDDVIF